MKKNNHLSIVFGAWDKSNKILLGRKSENSYDVYICELRPEAMKTDDYQPESLDAMIHLLQYAKETCKQDLSSKIL